MNFLLATVLFLEIFVEYKAQVSGDISCEDGEEYYTCRSPCETTCDNVRQGYRSNCSLPCEPGCYCRRGLVRADDRSCVPPSECIRPICQENEEFSECGSPCELNCTNINKPIFCAKPCYRGCFCKPNFVRNSRGKCVEPRQCRPGGNVQCPPNEEYVNCVNFCNTCYISEYCRTPYCTPGCDCKPGYFRNTYGQCITEEQCIAEEYALQQQCGYNEIYTTCVNPCNDCDSRGRCDDYLFNYCNPGCDCKAGFFRNDNGICVPEWNCLRQRQPVCPPGEEYYNCIPTCRVTCDTYSTPDVICDTTCNRGCFCKSGLIRRADGLCVLPTECPVKQLPCPEGETYYQCLPTCRTTCRNFNSSRGLCSTECKQGCFCQPGYVRNDYGICVPPSQCPYICGPNEEFRTCGSACPATCENFRERAICPQQRCLRGCFCKTGFVRGPRGICIRPRNCPVEKPTQCCAGGLIGRKSGNETDDITTTEGSITTTPVGTEKPSNGSSNASSSAATKPSATSKKVSDVTTPKSEGSSTTPKSEGSFTTPKSEGSSTTPKSEGSFTTPKSEGSSTVSKSESSSTTSEAQDSATNPKAESASTTPKTERSSTTSKMEGSSATSKPEVTTPNPTTITKEIPTTTSPESKVEPNDSTTNPAETPSANVTDGHTNNTELTTLTDLSNSTTAKP